MPKYDFSSFDKHPSQKYDFSSFDKHPSADSKATETPQVSYLESLLRGGAQGATLGFADELSGGGQALMDASKNEGLTNIDLPQLLANYSKHRDESRKEFDAAEQANPKTFLAGQIGGAIPGALLAPEAAGLKGMAAVGAGMGALSGAGTSKADLTKGDVSGFAKDVATDAAGGAILNASLGSLLSKFSPSALEKTAAERAVKATGANKSQIKKLIDSDRVLPYGKNLLDSNIVTAGGNPESILENALAQSESSGQEIASILNKLDSKYSVTNPEIRKDFFNPSTAIDKIKELQSKYIKNGDVVPLYKDEYNKLQQAIDTISQYGNKPINFSEASVLKKLISDTAYSQDGKLTDQLMGQVRGILNDSIEDAADTVTKKANDPALFQQYIDSKDMYRTSKDAYNAALGKSAGNLVNRDLGITDYMAGIGGAMAHGGGAGFVAAGVHKLAKTYGNGIIARTAYTGANIGKALTQVPQDVLKSSGEALIASGDQLSGKLGRVLIQAADRDDVGRNAVIFSLLQNPSYRELLQGLVGNNDNKTQ
jgi:hypothetical protein